MLSFLKEQGVNKSLSQGSRTPANEADVDGIKQSREQEYIAVASKRDSVRRSTILLVVLFGIGLLLLFFMIKKSTPATVSAASVSNEEIQIEKAITQLIGVKSEIFKRMEEIVKKFYEFSNVEQVAVEELAKNPFRHKMFLGGLDGISNSKGSKIGQLEILRQQIKQQAASLELLSIMQSPGGNCCVIDDRILYEGDSIKTFRVSQIGDNFVKLTLDTEDKRSFFGAEPKDLEIKLKLLE